MNIPKNEIHIHQYPLAENRSQQEIDLFTEILSSDELAKANRYKFNNLRTDYITSRYYLRKLAGFYLDKDPREIAFQYTDKEKPFLSSFEIKFNLAHSGNRCVYAFANGTEVGIDIELLRNIPDALDICKRFFSSEEIKDLNLVTGEKISETFLLCWTRKEAFIKAVGDGLSYPLADFTVNLDKNIPEITGIRKEPEEIKQWSLFNIVTEKEYIASLAVRGKGLKIIYVD